MLRWSQILGCPPHGQKLGVSGRGHQWIDAYDKYSAYYIKLQPV